MPDPILLNGGEAIASFLGASPKAIKRMVLEEGLPAWKGSDNQWRAVSTEIFGWAVQKRKEWYERNVQRKEGKQEKGQD